MDKTIQEAINCPRVGKYVIAVSGGVDSVSLLDILAKSEKYELVVAHFDHGIRKESAQDRKFVEKLSQKYGLEFAYDEGKLGPKASEETARNARYEFLNSIKEKYGAKAVITAHHLDDKIETSLFNIMRGTGLEGRVGIKETANIKRPLLNVYKKELVNYAQKNHLKWREDKTNQDLSYSRNYIRHKIIPEMESEESGFKKSFQKQLEKWEKELKSKRIKYKKIINTKINKKNHELEIPRSLLSGMSAAEQLELLYYCIKQLKPVELSAKKLELLRVFCLTHEHKKTFQISSQLNAKISRGRVKIQTLKQLTEQ